MTLQVAMFIVDTFSCIAFIVTAYYAFKANRDTAKINKHSSEKDRKVMLFYQQFIVDKRRERRIDDMVEYTQFMLIKWCRLTKKAKELLNKYKKNNVSVDWKEFDFITQKIDDNDVYFDGINLTFWRCALTLACRENILPENKNFELYVFEKIDEIRGTNVKFDCIIGLLLKNITEITGPGEFQGQLFQIFKNTTDIYQISHDVNDIIKCLYTNKLSRTNLKTTLKYRIPSTREEYDAELNEILGITSDITKI